MKDYPKFENIILYFVLANRISGYPILIIEKKLVNLIIEAVALIIG